MEKILRSWKVSASKKQVISLQIPKSHLYNKRYLYNKRLKNDKSLKYNRENQ
jgi:hypothetical protein